MCVRPSKRWWWSLFEYSHQRKLEKSELFKEKTFETLNTYRKKKRGVERDTIAFLPHLTSTLCALYEREDSETTSKETTSALQKSKSAEESGREKKKNNSCCEGLFFSSFDRSKAVRW